MLIGISVLAAAPVSWRCVSMFHGFCLKADQYLIAHHVSLFSISSTRMQTTEVRDLVSFSVRRIARDDTELVLGNYLLSKVIAEIANNCSK